MKDFLKTRYGILIILALLMLSSILGRLLFPKKILIPTAMYQIRLYTDEYIGDARLIKQITINQAETFLFPGYFQVGKIEVVPIAGNK